MRLCVTCMQIQGIVSEVELIEILNKHFNVRNLKSLV
jgi:hypothetical protein